MASKGKPRGKKKDPGILSGVPLGSALEVAEGIGSFLVKYLSTRYEVEQRVEEIKEDTAERVEELREEAVRTGYAVKKAFFRSIVEATLLTTGMLSLILGLILVVKSVIPLEYVLVGYGLIVTAAVIFQLKTAPDELPRD